VFWEVDLRADYTGVAVGAFHDCNFPPPTRSVWEESKHEWVAFAHDIPHFAQARSTQLGLEGLARVGCDSSLISR
jgi:hypothetical protein